MPFEHSYKKFFYVALPCEAKPLIAHYKLKKDLRISAFSVFGLNDVCLTVTGVGKNAMSAAVAYTQALFASEQPVLINVGVAGHQHHGIGLLYLASKIVDLDSERCFYPPLVIKTALASATLYTKALPQLAYNHDALCDMEASAFYETAIRFSSSEWVQCLKVVSDNAEQPASLLHAEQVSDLVAVHGQSIAEFVEQLASIELPVITPQVFIEALTQRYHFTSSAKAQLHSLLQRWMVLNEGVLPNIETLNFKHSKAVLTWLEQQLATRSWC